MRALRGWNHRTESLRSVERNDKEKVEILRWTRLPDLLYSREKQGEKELNPVGHFEVRLFSAPWDKDLSRFDYS